MTDIFLCVFCSEKMFFKRDLRDHIYKSHQNKTMDSSFNGQPWKTAVAKNRQFDKFVESLVNYCSDLEICFPQKRRHRRSVRPRFCLPEGNVEELMVGCRLCDLIIGHYKLETFDRKDKPNRDVCICGNIDDNQFKAITCTQCQHSYHFECYNSTDFTADNSTQNLCKYCQTMEFTIKTVNDMTQVEQLTHIRQHLNYKPIGCTLANCGKNFFTLELFVEHLKKNHRQLEDRDIKGPKLKALYTFNPIEEIEQLFDKYEGLRYQSIDNSMETIPLTASTGTEPVIINNDNNHLSPVPNEAANTNKSESNRLKNKLLGSPKVLQSFPNNLCDNQLEPIASTSSDSGNNTIDNHNLKKSSAVEQSPQSANNAIIRDVMPTVSISESLAKSDSASDKASAVIPNGKPSTPTKITTPPVTPSKSNFSIPHNKKPKGLAPDLDKEIEDLIQLSNNNRNLFDDKNLTKTFEDSIYSILLKCHKLSEEESNQIHSYLSSNIIPYVRNKFSENVFKYQKKIIQKEVDIYLFKVRAEVSQLEQSAKTIYEQMMRKYKSDQAKGKKELEIPVKSFRMTSTIEWNLNKAIALKLNLYRLESKQYPRVDIKFKDFFEKFIKHQVMDCWSKGWISLERIMRFAKPQIKPFESSNSNSPQKSDRSSASNASEISLDVNFDLDVNSLIETPRHPLPFTYVTNGNSTQVKDNSSTNCSPVKKTSTQSTQENESTLPTSLSDTNIEPISETVEDMPIIILSSSVSPSESLNTNSSSASDSIANCVADPQLNQTSESSPENTSRHTCTTTVEMLGPEENDSNSSANCSSEVIPLIPKSPHNKRKIEEVLVKDCEDIIGEPKPKKQRMDNETNFQMDVDLSPEEEVSESSDNTAKTSGVNELNEVSKDSEESPVIASTSGLNSIENSVQKSSPLKQTECSPQIPDPRLDNNEINENNTLNIVSNVENIDPMDEWLLMTKVVKFPYFPQLEDKVVYLRSGHYHYIQTLRERKLIPNQMRTNFRTHKYSSKDYRDFEYILAIVREISFESKPFVSIKLKLEELEPHEEQSLGTYFEVQYNRLDGVSDFIFLRSTHEISIDRNWTVGDSFQRVTPDGNHWKAGVITEEGVFPLISRKFPFSDYKKFSVNYSDNISDTSPEMLSPWDLEPNVWRENQTQTEITHEERLSFYETVLSDWSKNGEQNGLKPAQLRDRECDCLSTALDELIDTEQGAVFELESRFYTQPKPVYKIDLNLIKERIKNRFYRRSAQIIFDLNAIKNNLLSIYTEGSVRRNYEKLLKVAVSFVESDFSKKPEVLDIYDKELSIAEDVDSDDDIQDKTSDVTTSQTQTELMECQSVNESQLIPEFRIKTEELSQENVDESLSEEPNDVDVRTQIEFNDSHVIPVLLIETEVQTDIQINTTNEIYLCVFCQKSTSFANKTDATEHIKSHFGSGIQCADCRFGYETVEEFRNKEPEHSLKPKNIERIKEYYLTLDWIDSYLEFQRTEDFNKLVRIRNEFCPICASIKQMTVRPYIQIEVNTEDKDSFEEHICKHLKYNEVFECIKCCDESSGQIFKFCFDSIDAQNHLESHHSDTDSIGANINDNFRVNQTHNKFLLKNVIKKYLQLNETIDNIYENISI